MSGPPDDRKWWLDEPRNVTRIFVALIVVCVALLAADFAYHKHGHFDFELWFGFHAFFGFLAYSAIVFSAKLLRKLISRGEDYYD